MYLHCFLVPLDKMEVLLDVFKSHWRWLLHCLYLIDKVVAADGSVLLGTDPACEFETTTTIDGSLPAPSSDETYL